MASQGKPGIVWEFSLIFNKVREKVLSKHFVFNISLHDSLQSRSSICGQYFITLHCEVVIICALPI